MKILLEYRERLTWILGTSESPTNSQSSWIRIKESCPKGFYVRFFTKKKWGRADGCKDAHWRKNLTEMRTGTMVEPDCHTWNRTRRPCRFETRSSPSSRSTRVWSPCLPLLVHSVLFFLTSYSLLQILYLSEARIVKHNLLIFVHPSFCFLLTSGYHDTSWFKLYLRTSLLCLF